mgnify:CR=1 FL=1
MFRQKAAFLDRDGVLVKAIYRPDFVKKITCPYICDELEFVVRTEKVLSELKRRGFLKVLTTNQPDVALGYMAEDEWLTIHRRVRSTLELDHIKICRHIKESDCPQRRKKPSPGMLLEAADDLDIDLANSYMVGDRWFDVGAGKMAGCKTIFLLDGDRNKADLKICQPDFIVDNHQDILKIILC